MTLEATDRSPVDSRTAVAFGDRLPWSVNEFGEAAELAVTQFTRVPHIRQVLTSTERQLGQVERVQARVKHLYKRALYHKSLRLAELSGLAHDHLPIDNSDIIWAQTLERRYPTDPDEQMTVTSPIEQHYRRLLEVGTQDQA